MGHFDSGHGRRFKEKRVEPVTEAESTRWTTARILFVMVKTERKSYLIFHIMLDVERVVISSQHSVTQTQRRFRTFFLSDTVCQHQIQ
jgi:hypothetical protein